MKGKKKGHKKEEKADFSVLMVGQRRTGKSSMLSAMLRSMERFGNETGFLFTADKDTEILMQTKLSQLERIFYIYEKGELFSTLEGSKDGRDYSLATYEPVSYRFHLGLKDKKSKADYIVEFTDIRGEDMLSDIENESFGMKERIANCSVIMIAVDAPALMEGKWKKGYGEYHDRVNSPDNIYECITVADMKMRSGLSDGQKIPPKLVLFVPMKCEKYYHGQEMEKLNHALKAGYKNLFAFLEEHMEYSVAITPILTLGDVIFEHYKTKELPSGKKIVEMFKEEAEESMQNTPKRPLFSFRNVERPRFSPLYCEQPLMYLLAYVLAMTGYMKKLEETESKKEKNGRVLRLLKHAAFYSMFGVFYIAFLGISSIMGDKKFLKEAKNVIQKIKLFGDGYELVFDNLGLGKVTEL